MKLIDDNFDDYFEKGAPKKDNTPHEETEEEREERELIETTIERRSNKRRVFLALGVLFILLLLFFLVYNRFFQPDKKECVMKGRIADIVLKGTVFETYECKMLSYDVVAQGNVVKSEFNFSVTNDSIAEKLYKYKQTPIVVQVHYKEYKSSVPWRGETKYIATGIDTVDIQSYIDNVKDIPLPQGPQEPAEPSK